MLRTILTVLVSTTLTAQHEGGDIVAADFTTKSVFRITPAGAVTTLLSGLAGPSGVAVTQSQEVLVLDYNAQTLFRLPRLGRLQTVATGLAGAIRIAVDHDGTYLVTSLTSKALLRVTPAGVVSTIYSGAPFIRPFGIAVDSSGDYLVTDDSTKALYRITPAGALSVIWSGSPFALPQGVALWGNGDFAVIDGVTDFVYRVPRAGGPPVPIVGPPTLLNPDAVVADFEGRVLISESHIQGNRIELVEPNGKVTAIASGTPFQNLEALARVPTLHGPVRSGPGQTTKLGLDFPGQGGRPYAVWASLSLHPGIPLGGSDTRWIAGNLDLLFQASFGANNALFAGWVGALVPPGTAAPALAVPQVTLPPLTLFVQALTIDPSSPGLFGNLSNVHVLKL